MILRLLLLMTLLLGVAVPSSLVVAQEHSESATESTVGWTDDPVLGIFLTDPDGMTLYVFDNDTPGAGKSTCADQCAANWPPFTAEEPLELPEGVPGELSLITRDDGTQQLAYEGMPLYTFVKDEEPGDTTGEGVGGNWHVASVGEVTGATPVASPAAAAGPTGEGVIVVELTDFAIEPSETTLQAGREYTFVVTNNGVLIHEFVIEPAGAEDEPLHEANEVAEIEDIEPGETDQMSWTFEAGSYQFTCHIPGHLEAGMIVQIAVE